MRRPLLVNLNFELNFLNPEFIFYILEGHLVNKSAWRPVT